MKASVGVNSDVGRTREANEDAYLVRDPLFVVADGMGGHVAGDVASRTAVDRLSEETDDGTPTSADLPALVRGANAAVFNKSRTQPELSGMGTTCTVLLLEGPSAHLAHVGDSRAYLFRDGRLGQVTEDHTLVQRMVKEGRLSQAEAHSHPQRNIITRVLGVDADVSVDTYSVEVAPGDRFLLCSDGLSSMLEDAEIEEALRRGAPAQETADELVALANQAGGEDNITVLIVDIEGSSGSSPGAAALADSATDESGGAGPAGGAPPPSRASERDSSSTSGAPAEARPSRPWVRVVVGVVLVVGILLAAAYIGARYLWIERSFYVGVNETGAVTIYKGIPQDFAGMTLHEEQEVSDLQVDELPESFHDDLEAGITTDSLEEAQERVDVLEERASDREFETEQNRGLRDGGNKGNDNS